MIEKGLFLAVVALVFSVVFTTPQAIGSDGPEVADLDDVLVAGDQAAQDGSVIAAEPFGGPDAFGYSWDFLEPYVWADISDGNVLQAGDEYVSSAISMGFSFSYYGVTYSSVHVTTNGHLSFIGSTSYDTLCDESLMGISRFAGIWIDLNTSNAGAIYYKTVGYYPNRKFIVQWDNVPFFYDTSDTGTFQVVLEEYSDDVVVYIRDSYQTTYNNLAIRGISDGHYLSANCGVRLPQLQSAVRFSTSHCAGCTIGYTCYSHEDPNPNNPCEYCNAVVNRNAWTDYTGPMCNEGLYCTCVNGQCAEGQWVNCPDDGLFCNGPELCDDETRSCESLGDPCGDDQWCNGTETCNETWNECEYDDPPCQDDNAFCNGDEYCVESAQQCRHTGDPCNDGLWCNGNESCNETYNYCVDGVNACPDDGAFCNGDEYCVETFDICLRTGNPCGDGLFCNGSETCQESSDQCVQGSPPCSDDGSFCNGAEICIEASDSCDHEGDPCTDNLFCNGTEACNEWLDRCDNSEIPCVDDGYFCNGEEYCSEALDMCGHSGNPCNADSECSEQLDECLGGSTTSTVIPTTTSTTTTMTGDDDVDDDADDDVDDDINDDADDDTDDDADDDINFPDDDNDDDITDDDEAGQVDGDDDDDDESSCCGCSSSSSGGSSGDDDDVDDDYGDDDYGDDDDDDDVSPTTTTSPSSTSTTTTVTTTTTTTTHPATDCDQSAYQDCHLQSLIEQGQCSDNCPQDDECQLYHCLYAICQANAHWAAAQCSVDNLCEALYNPAYFNCMADCNVDRGQCYETECPDFDGCQETYDNCIAACPSI
jgi:hypothetical protein